MCCNKGWRLLEVSSFVSILICAVGVCTWINVYHSHGNCTIRSDIYMTTIFSSSLLLVGTEGVRHLNKLWSNSIEDKASFYMFIWWIVNLTIMMYVQTGLMIAYSLKCGKDTRRLVFVVEWALAAIIFLAALVLSYMLFFDFRWKVIRWFSEIKFRKSSLHFANKRISMDKKEIRKFWKKSSEISNGILTGLIIEDYFLNYSYKLQKGFQSDFSKHHHILCTVCDYNIGMTEWLMVSCCCSRLFHRSC